METRTPSHASAKSNGAVLSTKLYIPQVHDALVSRPRLTAKLDKGARTRLTLVCAPAGFGKTTLLGQWLFQGDRAVAWLSLDDGDNDPIRFLSHVIASLQTVQAGIGEAAWAALYSPQHPPLESILTLLLNEVTTVMPPLCLVLDDYHVIKAGAVHDALRFLLEHLPPQMHLVITSRSDPPLPLARLRARGELLELRSDELRFTPDETATFLRDMMGLSLSAEDIIALEGRTEGWIAGLQLAALSMQGRGDLCGFIAAFTGSHRYILDYLVEEVLQDQAENVLRFLLQTSILERLTGPLCDAVTGQPGSQEMLESLERANLFLIPLDDDRRWYRYHHLFAEVLQNRLQSVDPTSAPKLHRQASRWFESEGLLDEALRHALAAPDLERAATLIEQHAWPMCVQGNILAVRAWLERLPQPLVRSRPQLTTTYSLVLTVTGQLEAAERLLAETAPMFTPDTPPEIRGELALVRSTLARFRGDVASSIGFAREALEHLPQDRLMPRGVALFNLVQEHLHAGDLKAAGQVLDEMVKLGEAGSPMLAQLALLELGRLQTQQGCLFHALESYRSAISQATRGSKRDLLIMGELYIPKFCPN
jgi:LuxR family transcriptional regulator, maltose regulon positive regulatory protein